jgi:hypothetical protein
MTTQFHIRFFHLFIGFSYSTYVHKRNLHCMILIFNSLLLLFNSGDIAFQCESYGKKNVLLNYFPFYFIVHCQFYLSTKFYYVLKKQNGI